MNTMITATVSLNTEALTLNSTLDIENYPGNAVINYTDAETPYTRIIEHKHFEGSESEKTVITKEYPKTWTQGEEAYYPMNDEKKF